MSLASQVAALATRIGQEIKTKVPLTRTVSTANGLQGGGDLTANRTLSPVYGSTVNTVCQGNDARLSDARTPAAGSVTNSSVASNAAIALSKLAAGYVQGSSNGAATTLTLWVGTEAQYAAIGTKDANTVYVRLP